MFTSLILLLSLLQPIYHPPVRPVGNPPVTHGPTLPTSPRR